MIPEHGFVPPAPSSAGPAETDTDIAGALAAIRDMSLERFPRERHTLEAFFGELARQLEPPPGAAPGAPPQSFEQQLGRLEELLEALLVGEAHGLVRR
jgi:hypothetical protein